MQTSYGGRRIHVLVCLVALALIFDVRPSSDHSKDFANTIHTNVLMAAERDMVMGGQRRRIGESEQGEMNRSGSLGSLGPLTMAGGVPYEAA